MMERAGELVTVFGGGGFIGRYVCEVLMKSGVRVRVAQRNPRQAYIIQPLGQVGQFGFEAADISKADGLQAAGARLSLLSYEAPAEEFSYDLVTWWNRCQTPPVVVAAVNAQDIPTLFVKDRHNVLDRCYVAGFFLWETSKAPQVQHLGIRLVNEIWVPTQYVGSVYAPFAPVHVVGKGLFSSSQSATSPSARSIRAPIA